MSVLPIVDMLDQISDEIESTSPQGLRSASLVDEASSLILSSSDQLLPEIEELASVLRSHLSALDYDASIQTATDLMTTFGDDGEMAKASLPINNREKKEGPHPGMGLYAPGKLDWWNVKP